jgi:hypothetical protein
VKKFISSTKQEYNQTLVYSKLYANDATDFTEFIQTLFNKSPNGAIIINFINGDSYYTFSKQMYEMYTKRFPNIDKSVYLFQPSLPVFILTDNNFSKIKLDIILLRLKTYFNKRQSIK